MRVLVVAPDQPGISTIPEVRLIQSWHHTSTLNGYVTLQDVFRACEDTMFDVIHLATHGGPEGVLLSGDYILTAEDIAQVVRLKNTQGVFFNTCEAGVLAAKVVMHGANWAIAPQIELPDRSAWQTPAAFYSSMRGTATFAEAFLKADSGDGDYALFVSPMLLQYAQDQARRFAAMPEGSVVINRERMLQIFITTLVIAAVWTLTVTYLAGNIH